MHAAIAALVVMATPSPTPTAPPADTVTPGPWGFFAIAALGVAVIVLLWDMMRRIRRARYRLQVREELDEEMAQAAAAVDGAGLDEPHGEGGEQQPPPPDHDEH
ncbi:hypothetical protein GCM10022240_12100 [Microbacterium kribbense]|uniref:Uncharacterized protein n=1 Tax=Microbacterium kribbense TaxID=433645 RepID=A0ABP7GD14_9MICO